MKNDHDDKQETIEEEIKNVTNLCGQIENYVKGSMATKSNAENFAENNQKNLTSTKKKNVRKNLSMDDKNPNDTNLCKLINNTYNKKLHSSVDKKETITAAKGIIKNKNILASSDLKKSQQSGNKQDNFHQTMESEKITQKFEELLTRFKEKETERINKLNNRKKEFSDKEIKEVKKIPNINSNSKKIFTSTDDFLTRQERFKSDLDKKKEQLREEKLRKEQEKLAKEEKALSNYNNKKYDKDYIEKKINVMYEWDSQRKNKIEKLKEREPVYSFKPNINKNSAKIASAKKQLVDNNEDQFVDRLYNQDVKKRKQKKEILEEIYLPSFTPNTNHNLKNMETDANEKVSSKITKLNLEYMSSKDNNVVGELLKERIKMIKNKKVE